MKGEISTAYKTKRLFYALNWALLGIPVKSVNTQYEKHRNQSLKQFWVDSILIPAITGGGLQREAASTDCVPRDQGGAAEVAAEWVTHAAADRGGPGGRGGDGGRRLEVCRCHTHVRGPCPGSWGGLGEEGTGFPWNTAALMAFSILAPYWQCVTPVTNKESCLKDPVRNQLPGICYNTPQTPNNTYK